MLHASGEQREREMSCSYHFLQNDVVGINHRVKALLQASQLAPVSQVRSAAMVLHQLTHTEQKQTAQKKSS